MTASKPSGTALTDHALGKLPLQSYNRTHKLKAATTWWGKKVGAFTDWIEDVFARNSPHGDLTVCSNAQFPWVNNVECDWRKVRAWEMKTWGEK